MAGHLNAKTSTLMVVILDESGSMGTKESDVLGGFNGFIERQKTVDSDDARLFMVKFNTSVSVLHSGIALQAVPKLTKASYTPGGGTALYDAVAEGVRLAERNKKCGDRVLVLVMTDGEENSSRETTKEQVAEIIRAHEALDDWTFAYIGENPEKWAKEVQVNAAQNVRAYDHGDVMSNFEAYSDAVEEFRLLKQTKSRNFFSFGSKK